MSKIKIIFIFSICKFYNLVNFFYFLIIVLLYIIKILFNRKNQVTKQREFVNKSDKTKDKENNDSKKPNANKTINNEKNEERLNDKCSNAKESEYSESFRQLQEELLNDNIEYIIDDKSKNESNTYRVENHI